VHFFYMWLGHTEMPHRSCFARCIKGAGEGGGGARRGRGSHHALGAVGRVLFWKVLQQGCVLLFLK
jgi:hypothetical protein